MSRQQMKEIFKQELARVDKAAVAKRREKVIEGFTDEAHPKAVIGGKPYILFNSNDYLGLRHHQALKKAEAAATESYGVGPGAVRFISGALKVYEELEAALAKFHGREAGMVFSSAFATNLAVIFSLITGQSRDAVVGGETLVVSDELNHRSIIEGIRVAGLAKEQKAIFPHLKPEAVAEVLTANMGKFKRVLIVTDGVFSMLGEYQDLKTLRQVADKFDAEYPEGVWLVVDDAHGVAAGGKMGRGTEEVTGGKADVLIGTLGKGFGVDGGYVVADKVVIDYLREAAATYIYSNPFGPGTAGAGLAAVELVMGKEGQERLSKLEQNVARLKKELAAAQFKMAADSDHPIQPLLVGDPAKAQELTKRLFEAGIVVTSINYPVVPQGRDEIRIQLSATHTEAEISQLVAALKKIGKELGLV